MSAKKKILVIEDEPQIALGLSDALTFEGFEVVTADTGRKGVALAKQVRPNAVVLDLMLPDDNGFHVCEQLRSSDRLVPILMLTARSSEADKIRGLEMGADDYMTKPFSVGELIARMRAIFRRADRSPDLPETFFVGQAQVNLAAQTVMRGAAVEQLSFYEVGILRLLSERKGEPVSRDEILQKIWGLDAGPTNRTVDNFIVKLRRKLELAPDKPEHILTVYGFGYKLVCEAALGSGA
ncbi:MAG: response regulator transcription factor [Deltaproteobacteria bacterium]|nr:response regulator transcription factor [Deltaproteobacteria bacterium]